jgi:hypothetical protein
MKEKYQQELTKIIADAIMSPTEIVVLSEEDFVRKFR